MCNYKALLLAVWKIDPRHSFLPESNNLSPDRRSKVRTKIRPTGRRVLSWVNAPFLVVWEIDPRRSFVNRRTDGQLVKIFRLKNLGSTPNIGSQKQL